MKEVLTLSICFMALILSVHSRSLAWWCDQTTYPQLCKTHMNHGSINSLSISRIQFRDMTIHVAMAHATDAMKLFKWLDSKTQTDQEKTAWTDCMQFYDDTIFQIKKALFSKNRRPSDIQTWLSAARTNLQTCKSGIFELNAHTILPLISNNVTRLIRNALAINSVLSTQTEENYQSWLSGEGLRCWDLHCANVVVAQDGSGNFRTITEGLNASLNREDGGRFVIYVKEGVYMEYIEIGKHMTNIALIGNSLRNTIITGSRSSASGYNTYNSATVKVLGDGFIAHGITFQNTAGPNKAQAVALLSKSDRSAFYHCAFIGYQDTLWVVSQRQFYQQCYIYGTVDFIFGNAAVVLQHCNIYARRPMPGQPIVITAQGRDIPEDNGGISIVNSRVKAANDLQPVVNKYKVYLGRPWRPYSRTVFMESFIDKLVNPAGWLKWDNNPRTLSTLYYGEYRNYGPGSSTRRRVNWPGYKIITDITTAYNFTVAKFIGGQSWLPETGVPFYSGLQGTEEEYLFHF